MFLKSIGLQPHNICDGAVVSVASRLLWNAVARPMIPDFVFKIFLFLIGCLTKAKELGCPTL